ncbi:SA1788 family PVL leukocidin-associated protein [Staphylococcus succinus]|uniref:SA1788 family PVL leukocidin-associated protein n=1 Tax=Staphylococcus succinus TaxID=61015 RepID=UPI00301CA8FD
MVAVKHIQFKGQERTFKSLADEYGIKYGTIADRYSRGFREDDLVSKGLVGKQYERQTVMFKGEEVSLIDLEKRYGIKKATLRNRVGLGLKDDELVSKERIKIAMMDFKGERIHVDELAERFKLSRSTLRSRYNKGLRDDELIHPPRNPGGSTTFFINDEAYRLTMVQANTKARKKLSSNEIQERLNIGMSVDDALRYSNRYVVKFNELCYMLEGEGVYYYLPHYSIAELQKRGVSLHLMSVRIRNCSDIHETLDDPELMEGIKVYEEDFDHDSTVTNELDNRRKQERIKEYKDAKHREQRPWLYDGTKQQHSEGEYAKYLADSYTFACSDVKGGK